MASSNPSAEVTRLALALQANGAMAARALAQTLSISQATLSRRIARLGPAIERIGASVSTRYAVRRSLRHLGDHWPVYRIDERGQPARWGELRALHGAFRFMPAGPAPAWLAGEFAQGIFSGLPFFLQDVRPQGYLGRAVGREIAHALDVGADPRDWRDDDLLVYLLSEGSELPGNLVVGDRALEEALRDAGQIPAEALPEADRPGHYPAFAAASQRGEVAGSSAGGEQPKFLATIRRSDQSLHSVLVKFSAAEASPVSQRWADLLLCEHLAAQTLARHGIPSAATQIIDAGGRRFLEVERFDRIAAVGRRGMVALGTVEDALLERSSPDLRWTVAADLLAAAGLLDQAQARELRWRWCFGDLIGNTDMHRSNTSLWFGDTLPFSLTPSYDMLPMQFAPGSQGDLSERVLAPRPPLPGLIDVWREAARAATDYWAVVLADERLSPAFQVIARQAAAVVAERVGRFGSA